MYGTIADAASIPDRLLLEAAVKCAPRDVQLSLDTQAHNDTLSISPSTADQLVAILRYAFVFVYSFSVKVTSDQMGSPECLTVTKSPQTSLQCECWGRGI